MEVIVSAMVQPAWASAGFAALFLGSLGWFRGRVGGKVAVSSGTEGEKWEQRLESRRKRLYAVATGLLSARHPRTRPEAKRQIFRCNRAARKTYQLQFDLNRLIKTDGESEGRLRAAAVAALTEAMLRLREGVVQLHLDALNLIDSPEDLIHILLDGRCKELLDGATKAIGLARGYVFQISPHRVRARRAGRLLLVTLHLRARVADDIGASDLERSCDEAEQFVASLAIQVDDDINQGLGDAIEILSTMPDDDVLGQTRQIVQSCITSRTRPRDHSHPALRIRLLEMANTLAGMPIDWFNLRWMALLHGLIGWVELFAAYHCIATKAQREKTLERIQQARSFYHSGKQLSIDSSLHRRWSVRLQKFVGNSGISKKHPNWAGQPTRDEIDENLRGLIRAISEIQELVQK